VSRFFIVSSTNVGGRRASLPHPAEQSFHSPRNGQDDGIQIDAGRSGGFRQDRSDFMDEEGIFVLQ
jgi:hypothetical protein